MTVFRNRQVLKRLGSLLARLGGGDENILQQVPAERGRFIQMAGVLLTTAGVAVVSMTFALHDGVHAPLAWSIVLAFLWGIVILTLDRFLVIGMGAVRGLRRLLAIALPRLALAAVIGLVISTPLVLRIFASDIDAQLFINQQNDSRIQGELLANSREQQEANRLQEQIDENLAILDGNLPGTISNPQLETAQAEVTRLTPIVAAAQQKMVDTRAAWQCELYGVGPDCAGASDRPGPGPLAQAKEQEYNNAVQAHATVNGELIAAREAVTAAQADLQETQVTSLETYQEEARSRLPELQEEHARLVDILAGRSAAGSDLNVANTGLLAQLQALDDASDGDSGLRAAHLAVLALFFLLEILPVTVKFLLNLGPPTAYEVVAKTWDDVIIDAAQLRRAEERRRGEGDSLARSKKEENERAIEVQKSDVHLEIETDMRSRELDLGKRANAYVAGEMSTILDLALRQWSSQVQATLASANGGGKASNGAASSKPADPDLGLPDGDTL